MRKVISLFLMVLIFSGCAKPKSKLAILFERVDGLSVGSNVQNKGIKIGEVKRLSFFGKQVLADIELNTDIQVPVDSKFIIQNGILSVAAIDVEFSDNRIYLSSLDTVKGNYIQKALMDDLISDSTKRKRIEGSLQKIASGVSEIIEQVKKDSATHK